MPESSINAAYDHVWRSRTHLTDRVGQTLRVLIIGMMNSALVEFEDGHRCVTSRFGYRRLMPQVGKAASPVSVDPISVEQE